MKYSEPLSGQIWVFLAFLGVGFLLGALYLAFGFLRMLCGNSRRAAAACDLLFCFGAFTVLFSACLGYIDGVWRMPELLAAAGGFFAFRRTVAPFLQKPLLRTAAFVRRSINGLFLPARTLASKLAQCFAARWARFRARISVWLKQQEEARAAKEKQTKKTRKKHKKALAKPNKIRYNDI